MAQKLAEKEVGELNPSVVKPTVQFFFFWGGGCGLFFSSKELKPIKREKADGVFLL